MTRRLRIFIAQWLVLSVLHQLSAAETFKLRLIAFASPSIPPPPPISMPVWSLSSPIKSASSSLTEQDTSMNIVTFAVPVSVEPPKLWAVSLYYNTLTRHSMVESGVGVLQLLTPAQKDLVPILGKRSGYEDGFSKRMECEKLGHGWIKGGWCPNGDDNESLDENLFLPHDSSQLASLDLLPNCASYICLKLLSTTEAGDHELALCQVEDTGIWDDKAQQVTVAQGPPASLDYRTALYTGQLREEGII